MILRLFIFIILFSCNKKTKDDTLIIDSTYDSIKGPEKIHNDCFKLTSGYKKRFGVILSNYFEISSKVFYDFNNDNKIDTIVVLTPASLIAGEKGNLCTSNSKFDNRLLVLFENLNGKKSKIKIFNNIISNQSSVAWSGFEKLYCTENGFVLKKSAGQGCKFKYSIFVNTKSDIKVIDSINFSSFCPSEDNFREIKIQMEKDYKLEFFNRKFIDSIKIRENL